MVINALNCGAKVFMADFEDATTPTWSNLVSGQINLADANKGTIAFTDPASGKDYALSADPAVLIVRPRGWHLTEARSEEHTSELQSLMRISYAVFCLKKKTKIRSSHTRTERTN